MARPLRIELPGALYHVSSRGDRREDILPGRHRGDTDRQAFLAVFAEVCERFNCWAHADCLMTNHDHLLVETPDGNLSKGMRQLTGIYTQQFNAELRSVASQEGCGTQHARSDQALPLRRSLTPSPAPPRTLPETASSDGRGRPLPSRSRPGAGRRGRRPRTAV
ncbi:hypothetical protein CKO31_04085 [Thiohalocapsa halophila]|uniref:Transposase IS200-like domain-containing protein n=1 Tax=Thiohalocapsa halophila TaxID=69359 RepID=A0ABS1CEK7_9GAMM|nr:transposase [Thiohalocapsa halophila]MBK1629934.1 hypothetical protein [Thiohalocapsa halophila]